MRALPLIFCVLSLVGCTTRKEAPALSENERWNLALAVNEMVNRPHPDDTIPTPTDIPYSHWPNEVRKLHPLAVYYHLSNVAIALHRDAHEESGFYIVPTISSVLPNENNARGWSFQSLGPFGLAVYTRKL